MSAHEAEGLINIIQKLFLLNILLGLNFSAHCHPKHTKIVQGYQHIFPPISVNEGCMDSRYESWRILHISVYWSVNSSRIHVDTRKDQCKTNSIHNHMSVHAFPPWHVDFLRVCQTYRDFSGHNPELARQRLQELCENSATSGAQWRSNKVCC